MSASAEAELRANRVWESEGPALAVGDGPPAPVLVGAIRQTGEDDEVRTTLVVDGLSTEGGGRIEVFANDSCEDPEAEYLVEVIRTTRPGQTYRAIIIRGSADRDHYTATYTSPDGSTSHLSNCAEVASPATDDDGDGAADLLEQPFDAEEDPTRAVVVTEDERLLMVWTADGELESVALGFDPAPNSHPEGWELAYGALGFRVAGLEPGGETEVVLVALEDGQVEGSSYWKYGPEVPGGARSWYRFDVDEESGTGATLTDLTVMGKIRRAWVLSLRDGARGDSDGGANGTITDPGGPVLSEGIASPPLPVQPAPVQPVTPAQATGGAGSGAGELPRTGGDPWPLLVIGLVLLAVGTGLVTCAARRRLVSC